MAFVEGIQHAEDDEHTEVRIRPFTILPNSAANKIVFSRKTTTGRSPGPSTRGIGIYTSTSPSSSEDSTPPSSGTPQEPPRTSAPRRAGRTSSNEPK